MSLDRQINLFKVDTNAFLTDAEKKKRVKLIKIKKEYESLKKDLFKGKSSDYIKRYIKEHKKEETRFGLTKKELGFLIKTETISKENKKWKSYILNSAASAVKYNNKNVDNKHIRVLDERYLSYIDSNDGTKKTNLSNVISMFESTLSRSFCINTNELTYDIFVLEIYYYDIAQDLIINGFDYNGKHYVYFSSSAGQIRTKKAVFVEESKYNSCKLKLMCGLTLDKINDYGGMNINKFLAYLALSNSATDLWGEVFELPFDINRAIVVDDFETMVECKVDNIDYITYEITPNKIQNMPIPHTDGCGMILPSLSKKNFMVRLPWIKGLLGSFDYVKFINEKGCSPIVKDIWGKEYNIIEDDIQIIFTKSQLKMYKYYDSWDEYKNYFIKYGCEAGICNMEEDIISGAKINYQMLQTLYDMKDKEVEKLCKSSNEKIKGITDSLENALQFFGVYLSNDNEKNKDFFQKSLKIYPELLLDPASKQDLKDLKNSMINRYRGGRLDIVGKFTFVLPDLYAFCEWLFLGIETPKGILDNNEVYCRLYKTAKELDCLRSPHLYIEHAVRNNVCGKTTEDGIKLSDWFDTDAIYTSTYDLISRILQFDVDGDRLLVVCQKDIVEIAKRNMKGINPLYYEMKKAKAEIVNYHTLFNGLKLAFTGGNIGTISNDITKIWNSRNIDENALKAVRWLCMETNFTIDYAKTLFKPTRPESVDQLLKDYGRKNVPYFFYYAKDKKIDQVEPLVIDNECENNPEIKNQSLMNKIVLSIKDNKVMFKSLKGLDHPNYLMLIKDKNDIYSNKKVDMMFDKWNKKYGNNVNLNEDDDTNKNNLVAVANQVKDDLHKIEQDDDKIINSLVSFLYKNESTRKKKLLWYVYGEQLYNNILNNIDNNTICCKHCGKRINKDDSADGECESCSKKYKKIGTKIIQCIDCGDDIEVNASDMKTCRCAECNKIYKREKDRIKKKKKRQKHNDFVSP